MDPKLLGLALANAQGGVDSFMRGQDLAMKQAEAERVAQGQMMDLALRDSMYEKSQAIAFHNMLKSVAAPNESRIQQGIALATDPFTRVMGVQPISETEDPEVLRLRKLLEKERGAGYATDTEIGIGGRNIKDGFMNGGPPPAGMTGEQKQQLSIDKLRGGGRSPQSVESIVQPLEGDSSPYQDRSVMNMEPQIIRGNPDEELAINHVMGKLTDLNNPAYGDAYDAMRNPDLQRKMLGAMFKAGYVPGFGIQTDATEKRLAAIDQGQIMAAKSSTQMNQEASSMQAKLQMEKLKSTKDELIKLQSLIEGSKNTELKLLYERKMKEIDQKLRAWEISKPPAPRSGGGKEDPNKKDYRNQLNEAQDQIRKSVDAQIAAFGGVVSPEKRARIIKDTVAKDPSIAQLVSGLRAKAKTWPDVANNYSQLFEMAGQPLGGASTAAPQSGPAAGSAAARAKELLDARKNK